MPPGHFRAGSRNTWHQAAPVPRREQFQGAAPGGNEAAHPGGVEGLTSLEGAAYNFHRWLRVAVGEHFE